MQPPDFRSRLFLNVRSKGIALGSKCPCGGGEAYWVEREGWQNDKTWKVSKMVAEVAIISCVPS